MLTMESIRRTQEKLIKVTIDCNSTFERLESVADKLDLIKRRLREGIEPLDAIEFQAELSEQKEYGMNSPGILMDRMTILICKYCMSVSDAARGRAKNQLDDLQLALAQCKPARSIVLEKEATERQTENFEPEIEIVRLQFANIGMWLNQDLLYTDDVMRVSELRLRGYIVDFGILNRLRNIAIERIDRFVTARVGGGAIQ